MTTHIEIPLNCRDTEESEDMYVGPWKIAYSKKTQNIHRRQLRKKRQQNVKDAFELAWADGKMSDQFFANQTVAFEQLKSDMERNPENPNHPKTNVEFQNYVLDMAKDYCFDYFRNRCHDGGVFYEYILKQHNIDKQNIEKQTQF